MKVRSEKGRETLYTGCVYMPTDSISNFVVDTCYARLKVCVPAARVAG